jgi:hypothetical protein
MLLAYQKITSVELKLALFRFRRVANPNGAVELKLALFRFRRVANPNGAVTVTRTRTRNVRAQFP